MNKQNPPFRRYRHAFTLVEVSIALAILAFSFVSVLGMLPVSLGVSQSSIERTHAARIAQRMIALVQQTPFSEQRNLLGNVFWFDGDGEATDANSSHRVFSATIIEPDSPEGSATLVNGNTIGISTTTNRMLAVRIARNQTVSTDPRDEAIRNGKTNYFYQLAFSTSDMRL